jgi:hypothetical protein
LISNLHLPAQLAGPQPGIDIQPGLDGSVRAQELPQKIVAKIVANDTGDEALFYNRKCAWYWYLSVLTNVSPAILAQNWKGTDSKTFARDFNWLNPPIGVQVNGISDKFSQKSVFHPAL